MSFICQTLFSFQKILSKFLRFDTITLLLHWTSIKWLAKGNNFRARDNRKHCGKNYVQKQNLIKNDNLTYSWCAVIGHSMLNKKGDIRRLADRNVNLPYSFGGKLENLYGKVRLITKDPNVFIWTSEIILQLYVAVGKELLTFRCYSNFQVSL